MHKIRCSMWAGAGVVAACAAGCAQKAGVLPSSWEEVERQKYGVEPRPSPVSDGQFREHVVVGTTGPAAVHIGERVLASGGSAADAAVATSMAQVVLSGGSWNSFAGVFMMVYYEASTGRVYSLNAGYNTVLGETDAKSIPAMGAASGRATLVPGFMAGVDAASRKFGKLRFAELVQPAIELAEGGFEFTPTMKAIVASRTDVLKRRPETWRVFTHEDGSMYRAGEVFRQPLLAATLRTVAAEGASYMYTGPWAHRLVEAVASEGGKMTLEDLRRYEVVWSEPVETTFDSMRVCAIGLPEIGGVQLIEALNLFEASGGRAMGIPTEDPAALFNLMQVDRFGYLPSFMHATASADPSAPASEFDPARRLTKEHARKQAERLKDDGFETKLLMQLAGTSAVGSGGSHSDSVVAVDRYGNVAAVVHSSNNVTWGTTGIFVDGVSVPDSASFQQDRVAAVGQGVRFPNATNPAIVLRDGKPFLACGCIGSGLNEAALQNMVQVLFFGMDPKESLARPVILPPVWASLGDTRAKRRAQSVSKGEFAAEFLEKVRAMGQPVEELAREQASPLEGYWVGVRFDQAEGRMKAAISPRLVVQGAVDGR